MSRKQFNLFVPEGRGGVSNNVQENDKNFFIVTN